MKQHIRNAHRATSVVVLTTLMLLANWIMIFADDYSGGNSGSVSYNQQQLGTCNIGSAKVGMDGSASYSIPMGDIGLTYSSNGGWRLTGTNSITRSTKKGVPAYDYNKDTFELDGEELVYITGFNPREYRTKRESWQRILYYNPDTPGNSYWAIYRPDGSKAWYGNTFNSRIRARGGKFDGNVRAWALAQVQSRGGYTITNYLYWANPFAPDDGQYYLYAVVTSKKNCAANGYKCTLVASWIRNTSCTRISFRSASRVVENGILPLNVWVMMGTDSKGSGGNIINTYAISYIDVPPIGQMVSQVDIYGSDGKLKMPPFQFTYYKGFMGDYRSNVADWGPAEQSNYALRDHTGRADIFDMNGDGLPDRVYLDSNNIIQAMYGAGNGSFQPAVSWGKSDYNLKITSTASDLLDTDRDGLADGVVVDMIDMDGDGLPDRVYRYHKDFWVWHNNGHGFDPWQSWGSISSSSPDFKEQVNSINSAMTGLLDMNGDDLPDRIQKRTDGTNPCDLWVGLNNNGSFQEMKKWAPTTDVKALREANPVATLYDYIDMNGDGLPDRVCKSYSKGSTMTIWYNNGYGFENPVTWNYTDDYDLRDVNQDFPVQHNNCVGLAADLIDVNGDGLPDRIFKLDPQVVPMVAYNTGTGFAPAVPWSTRWAALRLYSDHGTANNDYGDIIRDFIDVNGDGYPDIIIKLPNSNKISGYLYTNVFGISGYQATEPDGLLRIAQNPQGGSNEFLYQPLNKVDNPNCKPNMYVVQTIWNYDGLAQVLETDYTFKEGMYAAKDREFRGFGYVKKVDPTGDYSETRYLTDPTFKGLVASIDEFTAAGVKLKTTNYSYQSYDRGNGCTFVYKTRDLVTTFDGDSARYNLITYSYDLRANHGNPIAATNFGEVDSSGNDIKYDETYIGYAYNNDLTNWIIGQVTIKNVIGYGLDSKHILSWGTQSFTKYTYDSAGNLTATYALDDNGNWVNLVQYFYEDGRGNLTRVMDARGISRTTAYDNKYYQFPIMVDNGLGQITYLYYDDNSYSGIDYGTICSKITLGRASRTRDINRVFHDVYYDAFGRVTSRVEPGDSTTYPTEEIIYSDAITDGQVIKTPAGVMVRKRTVSGTSSNLFSGTWFDGLSRPIQGKSRFGSNYTTVDTFYKIDTYKHWTIVQKTVPYLTTGWSFSGRNPSALSTFTYSYLDSKDGQVTKQTGTDNVSTYTKEKPWSTTKVDGNGNATCTLKDGLGLVTDIIDAGGGRTRYYYNTGTGQLIRVCDQISNNTYVTYNRLGQKTKLEDVDTGVTTYTYDANGNLWTQTDAKRQTITCSYDTLNRKTMVNYGSGSYDQFVYDYYNGNEGSYAKGKMARAFSYRDGAKTFEEFWAYDPNGNAYLDYCRIGGHSSAVFFTHDALGRKTGVIYPDGEKVSYTYDDNSVGAEKTVSGTGSYVSNTTYFPWGGIQQRSYGNGVCDFYEYWDNGEDGTADAIKSYRLKRHLTADKAGAVIMNMGYSYDNNGNITAIDDVFSTFNQSFGYDALNRLTAASGSYGTLGYLYDRCGNIICNNTREYFYTDPHHRHAATNDNDFTYTYDPNGNMITKQNAQGLRDYGYDWNNRLTTVQGYHLGGSKDVIMTADYNAFGNRIKLTEGNITTYYFNPYCEEQWQGGKVVDYTKYYYAGRQRIAWRNNSGLHYRHFDHLDSTARVTSTNGAEEKRIYYTPYGQNAFESAGTLQVNYRYNGKQPADNGTLYYYGARYYDPELSRFISPDPITPGGSDPQGLNAYSYCLNNPLNYIDPTGNDPVYDYTDFSEPSSEYMDYSFTNKPADATNVSISMKIYPSLPEYQIAARFQSHSPIVDSLNRAVTDYLSNTEEYKKFEAQVWDNVLLYASIASIFVPDLEFASTLRGRLALNIGGYSSHELSLEATKILAQNYRKVAVIDDLSMAPGKAEHKFDLLKSMRKEVDRENVSYVLGGLDCLQKKAPADNIMAYIFAPRYNWVEPVKFALGRNSAAFIISDLPLYLGAPFKQGMLQMPCKYPSQFFEGHDRLHFYYYRTGRNIIP